MVVVWIAEHVFPYYTYSISLPPVPLPWDPGAHHPVAPETDQQPTVLGSHTLSLFLIQHHAM